MHLLLWTVLTNVFLDVLHVELVIFFITLSHGRYLVYVIRNSKSVQIILFKLCTVFIYILKMFTCYYTPTSKDWGYKGITSICLSVHPDFVSRHTSVYIGYRNGFNQGWPNLEVQGVNMIFTICVSLLHMCVFHLAPSMAYLLFKTFN
jgi:hypothetical protein